MQLHLPTKGLDAYTSASQRARVATEAWAAKISSAQIAPATS
jgi:hypothetical protein